MRRLAARQTHGRAPVVAFETPRASVGVGAAPPMISVMVFEVEPVIHRLPERSIAIALVPVPLTTGRAVEETAVPALVKTLTVLLPLTTQTWPRPSTATALGALSPPPV